MGAIVLIFAFIMSLIINFIEKMITGNNDQVTGSAETKTNFATEQPE